MTICKHIPVKVITIWEPRWHDRRVLVAVHKVGEHNKIVFTGNPHKNTNSMGEDPYYLSGKTIKKFKKESNGTIKVYSVPLDELEPLEYKAHCEHEL